MSEAERIFAAISRVDRSSDRLAADNARLRALLAECEAVLEPFVGAFNATEDRYRKRGGNPETISQDAPWFELGATLLIGGKPKVAPELRILASPAPYRAARKLAAKLREARKGLELGRPHNPKSD